MCISKEILLRAAEHIGIEPTPAAGYFSVAAIPPLHFQLLWMAVPGRVPTVI
jgi:hypothetical protein